MHLTRLQLLLALIIYSEQSHPQYSYVCKENGDIDFKGMKEGSSLTVFGQSCSTNSLTATAKADVTINSNCVGTNVMSDRSVVVQVQDKQLLETDASNKPAKLIGGNVAHNFTLNCKKIGGKGIEKIVVERLNIKDSEVFPTKTNEVASVDMRFKATGKFDTPDISELYIGDSFYLFLKYVGDKDYIIQPTKCEAFAGNIKLDSSPADKSQVLWEKKNDDDTLRRHCLNTNAANYKLVGADGFTYDDSGKTVKIKVFAFHFNTINDITISCDVLIKRSDQSIVKDINVCPTPAPTIEPPGNPGMGRKRRAIPPHYPNEKHENVKRTLKVKDSPGNSSAVNHPTCKVISATVVVAMIWMGLVS